jgi:DM4/DM12 family
LQSQNLSCHLLIRAAPTRQQFIVGIGLPVDLGDDPFALTYGFALKAQYFLPYNVTQMRLPWFYDGKAKYRRDVNERYQVQEDELVITRSVDAETEEAEKNLEEEKEEQWSDKGHRFKDLRWILYRSIEMAVNGLGYDGRACMLRTICESAELPLSVSSGLLAELFHIVFT